MTRDDIDAAVRVQIEAFADLDRRQGQAPHPITDQLLHRAEARQRHLLEHDPAGAFVAVNGGQVVGCALASRRGDLWGLSLLVVDPTVQSDGLGRRLLDASLSYAAGASRAVILSSGDARAIRSYATSGFALHPQVGASGPPARDAIPALRRVRDGTSDDCEFADGIDLAVRGAAHGPDHPWMCDRLTMYVIDDVDGRGYAYVRSDGEVYLLAATDDITAAELLWRCLAYIAELETAATVEHLNATQQWAIETALRARLPLAPSGPAFWRGGVPPPSYLPSGAFL